MESQYCLEICCLAHQYKSFYNFAFQIVETWLNDNCQTEFTCNADGTIDGGDYICRGGAACELRGGEFHCAEGRLNFLNGLKCI